MRERRALPATALNAAAPHRGLVAALAALAAVATAPLRAANDTPSDFGGVGLLQMPTARFGDEADFRAGISHQPPYGNLFLSLTPFSWVEGTFHYSQIDDRNSYKDRGADLKLRLWEEGPLMPQVAIGLRDFAGTGLFAGEYLVANRRVYDFDLSLGLGWGRLGTRGQVKNPLTWVSDRFATRTSNVGQGGTPQSSTWFRGARASVIGGLEWATPLPGLSVKAEVDGNDYQSEPFGGNQPVHSALNFGAVYRHSSSLTLTAGLERGDMFMFGIAFIPNFDRLRGPDKVLDPPLPRVVPRPLCPPERSEGSCSQSKIPRDARTDTTLGPGELASALDAQGLKTHALQASDKEAAAWVANDRYANAGEAARRALRVMASSVPPSIEWLDAIVLEGGVETVRVRVHREDVVLAARGQTSTEEALRHTEFTSPQALPAGATKGLANYPGFDWELSPTYRQSIGALHGFYVFQLAAQLGASLDLTRTTHMTGAVNANVYNNFDQLQVSPSSALPHVRSDIAQYLKEGKNNLGQLELDQVSRLGGDWYGRLSLGIFEEMYGGIAGEVLYRPFDAWWAVGVDVNRVRKRDYDQRLDFLAYEVTTGHLTGYFRLPYRLLVQLSGGQYLAGDRGGTLDLSRTFASGVRAGVFFTRTNVPEQIFGEGSYDKGFYFTFPFDLFFARSSRGSGTLFFRPLTRDGGQKVIDGPPLYELLEGTSAADFGRGWTPP